MPIDNKNLVSSLSDEARLQYHLVNYIKLSYPDIVVHYNANGGKLSATQGYVNKLLGQVKGIPDLTIIKQSKVLFLELKTETGKLSKAQKETIAKLRSLGQNVEVAFGLPQAMSIVDQFIKKIEE